MDLALSDKITLVTGASAGLGYACLDILVSNAGGPPAGDFADLTPQLWEDAYNLTFQSTLRLCQAVLPIMEKQVSTLRWMAVPSAARWADTTH